THFTVRVLNKSDAGGPIRIVLDRGHFSSDAMLPAFEVNLAIFLFMSATDVPGGQPAVVIPAAGSLLHLDQVLMRLRFRNLLNSRQRRETTYWRERTKSLESHNQERLRKRERQKS